MTETFTTFKSIIAGREGNSVSCSLNNCIYPAMANDIPRLNKTVAKKPFAYTSKGKREVCLQLTT